MLKNLSSTSCKFVPSSYASYQHTELYLSKHSITVLSNSPPNIPYNTDANILLSIWVGSVNLQRYRSKSDKHTLVTQFVGLGLAEHKCWPSVRLHTGCSKLRQKQPSSTTDNGSAIVPCDHCADGIDDLRFPRPWNFLSLYFLSFPVTAPDLPFSWHSSSTDWELVGDGVSPCPFHTR